MLVGHNAIATAATKRVTASTRRALAAANMSAYCVFASTAFTLGALALGSAADLPYSLSHGAWDACSLCEMRFNTICMALEPFAHAVYARRHQLSTVVGPINTPLFT